jgi:hypothetical protein
VRRRACGGVWPGGHTRPGIQCPKEPLRFDAAFAGDLEVNRGRHRLSLDRGPQWPCGHSVPRSLSDPGSLPGRTSACSAPSGKTYVTVPGHLTQAACPRTSSGRTLVVHQLRASVDKLVDKPVDKSPPVHTADVIESCARMRVPLVDRSLPSDAMHSGRRNTDLSGRAGARICGHPGRHGGDAFSHHRSGRTSHR